MGVKPQGQSSVATDMKFSYLVELSHQLAIADNATNFDSANHYRLELGLNKSLKQGSLKAITGKIGYEVLESDNGASFSTPLATVHAFQG